MVLQLESGSDVISPLDVQRIQKFAAVQNADLALINLIRSDDEAESSRAKDQLIRSKEGLVRSHALKLAKQSPQLLKELLQEGRLVVFLSMTPAVALSIYGLQN